MEVAQKDILTVKKGTIVHQVNAQGVAGAGLAKALFDLYPKAAEPYRGRKHKTGTVQFVKVSDSLHICNLVGQSFYGRDKMYTEYWAVRRGLDAIEKFSQPFPRLIHFPWGMGCGLGGGDWSVVSQLISEIIPSAVICQHLIGEVK